MPPKAKLQPLTGAAPVRGRRERRRTETRELIFRTALGLFAERGFAATTVEDITEAADVGKGTFFNYFPSKEHVLGAFGEMQMAKVEAEMAKAAAGRESIRTALRRLVRKIAEEPGRSPRLARSLISALLISDEVRSLLAANLSRALPRLAAAISGAQRRGEVRRDRDAAEIARHILRSYFGTVVLWTIFPQDSLLSQLDGSFDLLWSSIAGD